MVFRVFLSSLVKTTTTRITTFYKRKKKTCSESSEATTTGTLHLCLIHTRRGDKEKRVIMGKASKNPKKNGRRMKVTGCGSHTESRPSVAAIAPAAAVASVDDTDTVTCTHGAVGRDTVAFRERAAALVEYTRLRNEAIKDYSQRNDNFVPYEAAQVEKDVFDDYWSKNSRLMDKIMIQMVHAKAADHVIRGDYAAAQNECMFVGKLELLRTNKMLDDTEEGQRQFLANYRAFFLGVRTERETTLSLTKLIPCSCLETARQEAKKWRATDVCQFCGIKGSQDKFLVCSACKVSGYCSRVCQKSDWNEGHKFACSGLAKPNIL
jgi:MYND finger